MQSFINFAYVFACMRDKSVSAIHSNVTLYSNHYDLHPVLGSNFIVDLSSDFGFSHRWLEYASRIHSGNYFAPLYKGKTSYNLLSTSKCAAIIFSIMNSDKNVPVEILDLYNSNVNKFIKTNSDINDDLEVTDEISRATAQGIDLLNHIIICSALNSNSKFLCCVDDWSTTNNEITPISKKLLACDSLQLFCNVLRSVRLKQAEHTLKHLKTKHMFDYLDSKRKHFGKESESESLITLNEFDSDFEEVIKREINYWRSFKISDLTKAKKDDFKFSQQGVSRLELESESNTINESMPLILVREEEIANFLVNEFDGSENVHEKEFEGSKQTQKENESLEPMQFFLNMKMTEDTKKNSNLKEKLLTHNDEQSGLLHKTLCQNLINTNGKRRLYEIPVKGFQELSIKIARSTFNETAQFEWWELPWFNEIGLTHQEPGGNDKRHEVKNPLSLGGLSLIYGTGGSGKTTLLNIIKNSYKDKTDYTVKHYITFESDPHNWSESPFPVVDVRSFIDLLTYICNDIDTKVVILDSLNILNHLGNPVVLPKGVSFGLLEYLASLSSIFEKQGRRIYVVAAASARDETITNRLIEEIFPKVNAMFVVNQFDKHLRCAIRNQRSNLHAEILRVTHDLHWDPFQNKSKDSVSFRTTLQ